MVEQLLWYSLLGIPVSMDDLWSFKHLNNKQTWVSVTQDITKLSAGVDFNKLSRISFTMPNFLARLGPTLHLLLFITRKYTFIYAKSCINNVNKFFINYRLHFIIFDRTFNN